MKAYFLSMGVGALVGIIYGVLNGKSPAPPVVALVGVFAMLGGEQVVKQVRGWRASHGPTPPVSESQPHQTVTTNSALHARP